MRKAELAELLLSMATDREHAASIVGDAIEDGQADNPCRFWFFVLRTALGQVWRRLAADPLRMGGAAVRAMFVEMGLLLLWGAALEIFTFGPVLNAWRSMSHENLPGWVTQLPFPVASAIATFALGRWLSRRYSGCGGQGIVTLSLVHALLNVGAAIAICLVALNGHKLDLFVTVGVPVIIWDTIPHTLLLAAYHLTLYPMLLLAGAMTVRARSLQSAA